MIRVAEQVAVLGPDELEKLTFMARGWLNDHERQDGLGPEWRSFVDQLHVAMSAVVIPSESAQGSELGVVRGGHDLEGARDSVHLDGWLDVAEAADRLSVKPHEVARWCRSGRLIAVQPAGPGTPWLIDPDSIREQEDHGSNHQHTARTAS